MICNFLKKKYKIIVHVDLISLAPLLKTKIPSPLHHTLQGPQFAHYIIPGKYDNNLGEERSDQEDTGTGITIKFGILSFDKR